MSGLIILKGSKEKFIKEIGNPVSSPLDMILHDLQYLGWNNKECNMYTTVESKVIIEDSEEMTEAYNDLKIALSNFETITNIKLEINPRGEYSRYNTIK